MIDFPYITDLCQSTPSKIVLLVVDGLGGYPNPATGKTELETAVLPNLDQIARESAAGLTTPIAPGVTPGSGPGHMALFGYDPIKYLLGRGVLEAIGIGIDLEDGDVAARGNFCTVDQNGAITDRRAGRIQTSKSRLLVKQLDEIQVPEIELSVYPVKEHRFVLVMRGTDLGVNVIETDPQKIGIAPTNPKAISDDSLKTANALKTFVSETQRILSSRETANMVLLRGFSKLPNLPDIGKSYKLNPAAIAAYPMYRGLAKLVGMEVLQTGTTFEEQLVTLENHFNKYDFFFLHYKPADTAGEDQNFDGKVSALEALDALVPRLLALNPTVLVVAGDHSTPAIMGSHSWHPVPLIVRSQFTYSDGVEGFSERHCNTGSIGRIKAKFVMMETLAHAGKLSKFGP